MQQSYVLGGKFIVALDAKSINSCLIVFLVCVCLFQERLGSSESSEDLGPLFAEQTLPMFSDYLRIAKQSGMVVMFDVTKPPVGHAHHSRYLNITLETIMKSGIPLKKVFDSFSFLLDDCMCTYTPHAHTHT